MNEPTNNFKQIFLKGTINLNYQDLEELDKLLLAHNCSLEVYIKKPYTKNSLKEFADEILGKYKLIHNLTIDIHHISGAMWVELHPDNSRIKYRQDSRVLQKVSQEVQRVISERNNVENYFKPIIAFLVPSLFILGILFGLNFTNTNNLSLEPTLVILEFYFGISTVALVLWIIYKSVYNSVSINLKSPKGTYLNQKDLTTQIIAGIIVGLISVLLSTLF